VYLEAGSIRCRSRSAASVRTATTYDSCVADRAGCKQVTSAIGAAVATRAQALSSPIFSMVVGFEAKVHGL
jgi:hypothetical protein